MKDISEFLRVYDEKKDLVFRTALHYLNGSEYVAQEIMQEVFLKLYHHFELWTEDFVTAWLVVTTKNEALNYVKKAKHEVLERDIILTMDLHASYKSAEDEVFYDVERRERIKFCRRILDDLYEKNERWYTTITMVYCLDKKQQEVADEMGISIEVLHSVLYRARKWIQKKYDAERVKY